MLRRRSDATTSDCDAKDDGDGDRAQEEMLGRRNEDEHFYFSKRRQFGAGSCSISMYERLGYLKGDLSFLGVINFWHNILLRTLYPYQNSTSKCYKG